MLIISSCTVISPVTPTPSPTETPIPLTPTPTATPLPPTPQSPRGLIWHYQDFTLYTGDGIPHFQLSENDWIPIIPYEIKIALSENKQPIKTSLGDWTLLNDTGEEIYLWNSDDAVWAPIIPEEVSAVLPLDTVAVMDDEEEWYIPNIDDSLLWRWDNYALEWVRVLLPVEFQELVDKHELTWINEGEHEFFIDTEGKREFQYIVGGWQPVPPEKMEISPVDGFDGMKEWLAKYPDTETRLWLRYDFDSGDWVQDFRAESVANVLGWQYPDQYTNSLFGENISFNVYLSENLMEPTGVEKFDLSKEKYALGLENIAYYFIGSALWGNGYDNWDEEYNSYSFDDFFDNAPIIVQSTKELLKDGPVPITLTGMTTRIDFPDWGSSNDLWPIVLPEDNEISGKVNKIEVRGLTVEQFEIERDFLDENGINIVEVIASGRGFRQLIYIENSTLYIVVADNDRGYYHPFGDYTYHIGFGLESMIPGINIDYPLAFRQKGRARAITSLLFSTPSTHMRAMAFGEYSSSKWIYTYIHHYLYLDVDLNHQKDFCDGCLYYEQWGRDVLGEWH